MNPIIILKIIAYILLLMSQGNTRENAVSSASAKFNVSKEDIWKLGGF